MMSTFHSSVPTEAAAVGKGRPVAATKAAVPGGATGTPATTAPPAAAALEVEERRRFHPNSSWAGFLTFALVLELFLRDTEKKKEDAWGEAGGDHSSILRCCT